jgi:hypothetical protein
MFSNLQNAARIMTRSRRSCHVHNGPGQNEPGWDLAQGYSIRSIGLITMGAPSSHRHPSFRKLRERTGTLMLVSEAKGLSPGLGQPPARTYFGLTAVAVTTCNGISSVPTLVDRKS